MRVKLKDWKSDWISSNGKTKGYEVRILHFDSDNILYEGSFSEIPNHLLDKNVLSSSQILTSSLPDHIGAYVLKI